MVPALVVSALYRAANEAAKKVPKDGEGVKSGPIGLAVILVLCVAVYFLLKSMSKHLKRVRDDFPTDEPVAAPPAENIPVTSGDAGQPAQPDVAPAPPKPDSA